MNKLCPICDNFFEAKRKDKIYCSRPCQRKGMYLNEIGGELKGRGHDLSGMRFGKLIVDKKTGGMRNGSFEWLCLCDCGNKTTSTTPSLRSGNKRSCGCLHSESARNKDIKSRKHGMWNTPTYKTWQQMKSRCNDTTNASYKSYGGKGINVCDSWLKSFENFLSDMGVRPKGMTIDRIDNSKGYFKENCRWQTPKEQANNRRSNVIVYHNGNKLTVEEYSKLINLSDSGARFRLKKEFNRIGNVFIKESDPAYASVVKSIEENYGA